MSDLTLGVDVSDLIARLAIVNGGVVAQGIVVANRSAAIKEAVKKAVSSAKGKIGAVAVALPSANTAVPDDLIAALAGIGKGKPTAIAAGTAAAIAEQWCGAARTDLGLRWAGLRSTPLNARTIAAWAGSKPKSRRPGSCGASCGASSPAINRASSI